MRLPWAVKGSQEGKREFASRWKCLLALSSRGDPIRVCYSATASTHIHPYHGLGWMLLHYCDPYQHVDRYLLNCCCPVCTCQNVDEEWTAATMLLTPLMCEYTCDAICVKFWNCYISNTTVMHTLLHCIYLKYNSLFLWMQFYFWSGIWHLCPQLA